jgi:negative regulator of sigma E activity
VDIQTHTGYKYFLAFIDDYSHYIKNYLLKHKTEIFEKFQIYKVEVENKLSTKTKVL